MATKAATTTAMTIVSRASRTCDVCASRSARWYCGADAAYLCDRCDTQVHTANSLAQRHERVRLTPTGAPLKKPLTLSESSEPRATTKKKMKPKPSRNPPPQVLPARKRTRSTRPHPHRPPRAEEAKEAREDHVKVEDGSSLFANFFDTEDFLIDHPQEVPSIVTDLPASSGSSYEYSPLQSPGSPSTCFSPDSFHGASSPQDSSFAACFKGKAAQDDHAMSADQFGGVLVPDDDPVMSDDLGFVPAGIDIICCDADGNISLASDACFIPGDIPGLDAFDDCGLGFDLALRGASTDAFDGERLGTVAPKTVAETDQYATGPFAKYFVTKSRTKAATPAWSPEIIKSEAKEILRCCTEGEAEEQQQLRPTLRLNYEEIIAAWSDRGEPWVNPECCNAATDVGLVPDMGLLPAAAAEEADGAYHGSGDGGPAAGGREARVSRYKEKRRSRLFSKTIRYEVRKLNAERRPRMKGRFVRRTNTGIS